MTAPDKSLGEIYAEAVDAFAEKNSIFCIDWPTMGRSGQARINAGVAAVRSAVIKECQQAIREYVVARKFYDHAKYPYLECVDLIGALKDKKP